jgi:hypothetical protein
MILGTRGHVVDVSIIRGFHVAVTAMMPHNIPIQIIQGNVSHILVSLPGIPEKFIAFRDAVFDDGVCGLVQGHAFIPQTFGACMRRASSGDIGVAPGIDVTPPEGNMIGAVNADTVAVKIVGLTLLYERIMTAS